MATKRVHLTFPEQLIKEPVIWRLGKEFDIVTNIRRAQVEEHVGWIVMELTGDEAELERGIEYLRSMNIQVDAAGGDVVEG